MFTGVFSLFSVGLHLNKILIQETGFFFVRVKINRKFLNFPFIHSSSIHFLNCISYGWSHGNCNNLGMPSSQPHISLEWKKNLIISIKLCVQMTLQWIWFKMNDQVLQTGGVHGCYSKMRNLPNNKKFWNSCKYF